MSGVGTRLRQRWRGQVPYTLTFDLEMLRIEGGKLLDGHASGDLEGACRWTLAPVDGGTELHFDVDVRTTRWWMNLPIPFASRVVHTTFMTIMGWGSEGLAQTLGVPVELRFTGGGRWKSSARMAADFLEQPLGLANDADHEQGGARGTSTDTQPAHFASISQP